MQNKVQKFFGWFNLYQGFITFLALIVAIVGLILYNKITIPDSFFAHLKDIILYNVQIPLYLILVFIIILSFSLWRFKNRYAKKEINKKFLVGTWKNEWNGVGSKGSEIFNYTKDGDYVIDGVKKFTIEDFKYEDDKKEITFIKTGVPPVDNRKALNVLKVIDNDTLVGTEGGAKIKYTRLPS